MSFIIESSSFAFKVFHKICEENPEKNILFSPFSLQLCLALKYFASVGKTREEICNAINHKTTNNDDSQVIRETFQEIFKADPEIEKLQLFSMLFINNDKNVQSDFKKDARKYFQTEIENIDLKKSDTAIKSINDKIVGKFSKLITENEIDASTVMAIITTMSLKTQWKVSFRSCRKSEFWLNDTDSIEIDQMSAIIPFYRYGEFSELDLKALEMTCDDHLKMLILLPNKKNGLAELEKKFDYESILNICENLKEQFVTLRMPKFKVEYEIDLKNILKTFGIKDIFEENANLQNLSSDSAGLKLDTLIQKNAININEMGTQEDEDFHARHLCICQGPKPKLFYIENPFLYAIKDDKCIYYLGRVKSIPN